MFESLAHAKPKLNLKGPNPARLISGTLNTPICNQGINLKQLVFHYEGKVVHPSPQIVLRKEPHLSQIIVASIKYFD